MPGWSGALRDGQTACRSPKGEEFDAVEYAYQGFQITKATRGAPREFTTNLI